MAIGNITKGGSIGGAISYVLGDKDHNGEVRETVELIGGTCAGTDADELSAEMSAIQSARPNLSVNTLHFSLRFPPNEREVSNAEQAEMADFWARGMGFDTYATVTHGDHFHIVCSRVNADGSVVSDSHEKRRSEQLVRQIEDRWNLIKVDPSHLLNPDAALDHKRSLSVTELSRLERTGEIPGKMRLQELIDGLLADGDLTVSDFIQSLELAGVDVRPSVSQTTTKLSGFAYGLDGKSFTSKDLGRGYTLSNLEKKGLQYEPDRDYARCREAAERSRASELARADSKPDTSSVRDPADNAAAIERHSGTSGSPGEQDVAPGRSPECTGSEPSEDGQDLQSRDGQGIEINTDFSVRSGAETAEIAVSDIGDVAPSQDADGGPGATSDRGQGHVSKSGGEGVQKPMALGRGHGGGGGGANGSSSVSNDAGGDFVMIENTGDPVADTIRFFQRLAAQARKNKLTGLEPRSGSGIDFNDYARQHYSAVNQFVQAAARTPSKITTDRMAKHLKAFGVASLEIQCLPPEGVGLPPDRLRTLSPKEVMQHAGYFAKMNSSGYDVYVRPAPKLAEDGKTVVAVAPYIFVDDVDKDKLARLKSLGLDLAIKIESSPGNYHGWVRISDTWLEPDVATQCAKMLAQEFGGDPRAADYRHFGRMAGFTNRKPSRRDASGKSPFVLLSAKEGYDVARSGPELIQAARQLVEARKQKDAERSAKVTEALKNQTRSLGQIGISHAAADAFAKFADKKDLSSLDFSVAMSLLARGFDPVDVQDEIRARSPDLAKRKGRDLDDYVARTVERAQAKIEQSSSGPRMR